MGDRRANSGRRVTDGVVKLPWMQFYIDDWTTSSKVRLMGPIARAWYMELLILQWRDGYIPDSERILYRILRAIPRDPDVLAAEVPFDERDSNDYPAILKQVLACFENDGNGHLVNPRLQEIRNRKLAEYIGKASGGGHRSGKRADTAPDSERIPGVDTDTDKDKEKSKALPPNGGTIRARQMPQEFEPKESHRVMATNLGVELAEEFVAFSDFHKSKGSRFIDWDKALNTWLRNARKFSRSNGNGKPRQSAFDRVETEARQAD